MVIYPVDIYLALVESVTVLNNQVGHVGCYSVPQTANLYFRTPKGTLLFWSRPTKRSYNKDAKRFHVFSGIKHEKKLHE